MACRGLALEGEADIENTNRNKLNPKSVVEIGCGAGEILNQLHLTMPGDVIFTGYDISLDAINMANKRLKERLNFRHEDFLETNEHFDLLLMIDVFEHVEDYLGFLRLCKGKATNTIFHIPLDITVMSILKDKLTCNRKTVGHLHYFTKETALATLADSGFEIVDCFYTPWLIEITKPKTLKSRFRFFLYRILYSINKDFAVKTLGGCSLIVLTK